MDPDQDLQSGSKLFTWYDVCCKIRGDYVLVVKFIGRDYVLVVKFSGGDYVLVVKFMGGILSTYTKMSRGGFVQGGFCPTLSNATYSPYDQVGHIMNMIKLETLMNMTKLDTLIMKMMKKRHNFHKHDQVGHTYHERD